MRIARDSLLIFSQQSVTLVLGIAVSIIVSRALGPNDRGLYFLVLTTSIFLTQVCNMGLDFSNLYFMAKGKHSLQEVHSNSILVAALLGAILLIVYLPLRGQIHGWVLKGLPVGYGLLAVALLPLTFYRGFWSNMMSGLKRFRLTTSLGIATAVLELVLVALVLLVLDAGLKGLLIAWAGQIGALALVMAFFAFRDGGPLFIFNPRLFKEGWGFGLRGQLGNVAYRIYNRLDIFVVNVFTGAVGVGHYSLAISLAERAQLLTGPVIGAANPRIGESPREEAGRLTARVIRHSLLVSILSALALLAASSWLVPFLYGREYVPTVRPLMVLLPGVVLITVSLVISSYFTYQIGRPEIPAAMAWFTLAVNIPLMFLMTSRFGFVGAASATTLTYALRCLLAAILFLRVSKRPWRDLVVVRREDLMDYWNLAREVLSGLRRGMRGLPATPQPVPKEGA